ncbi:MAG: hydroxymethylglutaryl-CoA lyase [Flavobacteriales bacterium]|nr:hydroxymethylglutaryl-CoA lyase [Flavobacteriales bacterium]
MQGIKEFIPTDVKADYINRLLTVGFDVIDFGSFVSPKAIPQMRDTAEVLSKLELSNTSTELLAIVANLRGAQDACEFEEIKYLGFPLSISETFQQRNTNSSIAESLKRVEDIHNECVKHNKSLVIYISMAFGNPYGDVWSSDIVIETSKVLAAMGIKVIALSDTIGVSNPENISYLFSNVIPEFPDVEIGAHLHTSPTTWEEKMEAAYNSGCVRFDSVCRGFGGCPMATDDLIGNMPTENVVQLFKDKGVDIRISDENMLVALNASDKIYM